MSRSLKRAALAVGALALGAGAASHAGAVPVLISHAHVVTKGYVVNLGGTVDGHAFSQHSVYESPDLFTVSVDGGPAEDMLAFCGHLPPLRRAHRAGGLRDRPDRSQFGRAPLRRRRL